MILLDSFTGIIHNVFISERSTLTIHFMRACRGSRLASARSFIFSVPPSAPQERISSPPTAGISSCPTGRISSAKRISFPNTPNITQPASIGKQDHLFSAKIERISQLGCERISTCGGENFCCAERISPIGEILHSCARNFLEIKQFVCLTCGFRKHKIDSIPKENFLKL